MKTVVRGNWPGKQLVADPDRMTLVQEKYVPPDRHAWVRGKTKYEGIINDMVHGNPPGGVAAFCPTRKEGRALVHGLVRYLKQNGLDNRFRPASKTNGESIKVWVIKKEQK